MSDLEPEYVAARQALLDALDALSAQRDAVILVGAQAIYLRTGEADLAVAPFTTDADFAIVPELLTDDPRIEALMKAASFTQEGQPGSWLKEIVVGDRSFVVPVDLMVPEGYAPRGGRRGARIDPHDRMATRKAVGLEAAVVDNDLMEVTGLGETDGRLLWVRVAGPAALILAKAHKLHDRIEAGRSDRIADKDAADVYRIMQAVPVPAFLERLEPLHADPVAGPSSLAAVDLLTSLFGARRSPGVVMATESLRGAVAPATVEAVCTSFVRAVREGLPGD
jgi:hypothetical protein